MIVRELITMLGFEVDEAQLKRYERTTQNAGRVLSTAGRNLTLFVSTPLALLGGFSLKAASDVEQLGVAFTTMLGDAERAGTFIEELIEFAARTPFEIENIGPVAKQLLAVGFSADEVIPALKNVGDVAAGVGAPLDRLILNLGQVRTQGKLTGRELRDFAVNGVPLLEALADSMGKSKKEVGELVSKGLISFEMVMDAFRQMSSEGGRFANLMDKQAQTLAGRWSQLVDSTFKARVELGMMLAESLRLKEVIDFLTAGVEALVGWLQGLAKWQRTVIVLFGAFLFVLGPVLLVIGTFLTILTFIITNAATILIILKVTLGVLTAIGTALLTIVAPLAIIFLIVEDIARWTQGYPSLFGELVGPVETFMDNVVFWIDRIKTAASNIIGDIKQEWLDFVENVVFWLGKIPLLGKKITGALDVGATVVGEGAASLAQRFAGGSGAAAAAGANNQQVNIQGGPVNVTVPPGTPEEQARNIAGVVNRAVDDSLRRKSRQIVKSTQANE